MTQIDGLILKIVDLGVLEIRDIDNGEEPFTYTSGHKGPGYVSVKKLIGDKQLLRTLVQELAIKVIDEKFRVDFVAGNVSGGMIPGYLLSEFIEAEQYREVPFVYVRSLNESRHDSVVGLSNISKKAHALVVEELINFGNTTCHAANVLRLLGYNANHAACFLYYGNPSANDLLSFKGIDITYLFTLDELLNVARTYEKMPVRLIEDYRTFLRDPDKWQKDRGFDKIL
jgi:orotate phosphoribosyltransferase